MISITDIKKRLQRYSDIKENAKEMEIRIHEIRDRMTSISSQSFDTTPGPHSNSDKIGETIAKLIDLENMYLDKIGSLAEEEIKITRLIESLDTIEQKVIRYRYIDCKKWEEICCLLNYGWAQLHRIHSKSLVKLENMIHNDTL